MGSSVRLVGTWEAPGQPQVIVEDDGYAEGFFGPWVTWRFSWNGKTTTTLRWPFMRMLEVGGYKRSMAS